MYQTFSGTVRSISQITEHQQTTNLHCDTYTHQLFTFLPNSSFILTTHYECEQLVCVCVRQKDFFLGGGAVLCACVRACVRARACVCVCVCVCVRERERERERMCVRACVSVCLCVRASARANKCVRYARATVSKRVCVSVFVSLCHCVSVCSLVLLSMR